MTWVIGCRALSVPSECKAEDVSPQLRYSSQWRWCLDDIETPHSQSTWLELGRGHTQASAFKSVLWRSWMIRKSWGAVISFHIYMSWVAQMVKNAPAMWETRVCFLGREDLQEEDMATQSSILAWRIPWTEEPGRLESMGSQRVGHDWVTSLSFTVD